MTNLHCNVEKCANNKRNYCCRPDVMVGGPQASASTQTYCANFIDAKKSSGMPQNAIDHDSPNSSLDVHCEVGKCAYNQNNACQADHIDIRTIKVNGNQLKTECATFKNESTGGKNSTEQKKQTSGEFTRGGTMEESTDSENSSPNLWS